MVKPEICLVRFGSDIPWADDYPQGSCPCPAARMESRSRSAHLSGRAAG